jgi:Domain of unknown function (DUF1905)
LLVADADRGDRGTGPRRCADLTGHTYRYTIAVMGGQHAISVSKDIRTAAGLKAGDTVNVTFTLDPSPRDIDMPRLRRRPSPSTRKPRPSSKDCRKVSSATTSATSKQPRPPRHANDASTKPSTCSSTDDSAETKPARVWSLAPTHPATRWIDAARETVLAALVDPDALIVWLSSAGMTGRVERFDPSAPIDLSHSMLGIAVRTFG